MNNVVKLDQFKTETIISLKSARGPLEFKQNLLGIVNKLGFSDFDLIELPDERDNSSLASSVPSSLHETYNQEAFYEYDASLECLMQTSVPVYYAEIYEHFTSAPFDSVRIQKNKLILELMKNYGFEDGYSIPSQVRGSRSKFVFTVLTRDERRAEFKSLVKSKHARLKQLVNISCQEAAQPGLFQALSENQLLLTKRQIEVLNALAHFAKTNQQVADHLGISVRTVTKHVEDIKTALGACSVANAVSLAIGYGLIKPYC